MTEANSLHLCEVQMSCQLYSVGVLQVDGCQLHLPEVL